MTDQTPTASPAASVEALNVLHEAIQRQRERFIRFRNASGGRFNADQNVIWTGMWGGEGEVQRSFHALNKALSAQPPAEAADQVERVALALVNEARKEHDLPPCAMVDLTASHQADYLRKARAALSALAQAPERDGEG